MESAKVIISRNLPLGHRTLDLSGQSGHMSPQSSKSSDKSAYFCSSVCLELQHYARLRVICLQDQNCPRDLRRRSFPLFILSITFPLLRLLISGRVQIWDFVFRCNARLKNEYCKECSSAANVITCVPTHRRGSCLQQQCRLPMPFFARTQVDHAGQ